MSTAPTGRPKAIAATESSAQPADASPKKSVTLTIVHRPAELTIDTETDGRKEPLTYNFDERDARPQPIGTAGDTVESALVHWEGAQLVTMTVYRVNGMAVKKTNIHRLSAHGIEMTVETQLQVQHGYNGRDPAAYTNAKDVYRKSTR